MYNNKDTIDIIIYMDYALQIINEPFIHLIIGIVTQLGIKDDNRFSHV